MAHFNDFTGWKNEGFGVWLEHGVRLDGAVLADNRVGLLARDAVLRDALGVGQRTNAADRPWQTFGIGLYSNRGDVADVDLVNFRSGDREAAAVHFVDGRAGQRGDEVRLRTLPAAGLGADVECGPVGLLVEGEPQGHGPLAGRPAQLVAERGRRRVATHECSAEP